MTPRALTKKLRTIQSAAFALALEADKLAAHAHTLNNEVTEILKDIEPRPERTGVEIEYEEKGEEE